MKAAAAREPLPGDLPPGDFSRLLGDEFVAEKVARSFIPQGPGKLPAAPVGKISTGESCRASPSKDMSPRDIVLSPDPEIPPSVSSPTPQLDSPTARNDMSPGKMRGPGGEAWEDYLAKRVGNADEKPVLVDPHPKESSLGDQSPSVSRIPSPSKRPQRSSLPETGESPGSPPLQTSTPSVQTMRPPSVISRPLSSQPFRSASLRIRVADEDDSDPKRFIGERVRRFSSQEGGIAYLVGMGFGPRAAAAATARFGTDLAAAVAWLLEQPGRGVDPADMLAGADRDPFPLTPPADTRPAARNGLNTEPISSDTPPGVRASPRRHVAGGESKIPSPPRRDGNSPNGSPVKKPMVVSPSVLKPQIGSLTPSAASRSGTPEVLERNPSILERNPSILDRIGTGSDDSDEDEELEVVVGTEVGRRGQPPASPLSQMIGSLWGRNKSAPGTPTGQTKIEKGLVANNVEK